MSGNFKKDDLRVLKTHKALMAAMSKLLEQKNFTHITVNDLCEDAQISRTTFYFHFYDKYDLLKYWLINIKSEIKFEKDIYDNFEKSINDFVNNNKKVIKNLIEYANDETIELLDDFILSLLGICIDKTGKEHMDQKYIILSEFCSGGILKYLLWQVKNKFPEELPTMNIHLYDILMSLLKL